MLEEEATLLEEAEGSQIVGATRDEEGQRPFKKARRKQLEKYCRSAAVKIGVLTYVRGI